MRKSKKLAVIGVLTVIGLVGGLFVGLTLAKADDLLRTDVGRRDVPVYKNGNASAGQIDVRLYASQFDKDEDGDTLVDSQRAVCRAYKHTGARRIQINTCRLQQFTSTGWETIKSTGTVNSGTKLSVATWTAPPSPFTCNGDTVYRVQVVGLVRWNDNSLNSFNLESGHWINYPVGGAGTCEPIAY